MACQGVLITLSPALDFDVDSARVGRTLLSDAFDVDLDFAVDLAFDLDREGRGFSRAENAPPNSTRLQPLKGRHDCVVILRKRSRTRSGRFPTKSLP
jgi:hypothetical protein